MFDIYLRGLKDRMVDPISGVLPLWLSPNVLTLSAFLVGIGSCLAASRSTSPSLALFLWLGNRLLDCLDGSVARKRKKITQLGGFLDLLGDFIVYSLIPLSIALGQDYRQLQALISSSGQSVSRWKAVAVLEASFHVNNFVLFYTAAVSSKLRAGELTSVTMQPALIEGFESGLLFTAMLAFPAYLSLLSWIMAFAVAIGTLQRATTLLQALSLVDGAEQRP